LVKPATSEKMAQKPTVIDTTNCCQHRNQDVDACAHLIRVTNSHILDNVRQCAAHDARVIAKQEAADGRVKAEQIHEPGCLRLFLRR
jgi:hypothetical protein